MLLINDYKIRVLFSELLCLVVWYNLADVSEEDTASIFRVQQ
jgi:hypothetical protein